MKILASSRPFWYAALTSLGVLFLACMATAWPALATKTARQAEVVYHIDDSQRAISMLRNIVNHHRAAPKVKIVVVALSRGVDFLVDGAKDDRGNSYDALIDPLITEGVEFRVCNDTLEARKIDPTTLLPDVKQVPSGVAEIARMQIEEGAAYIKP